MTDLDLLLRDTAARLDIAPIDEVAVAEDVRRGRRTLTRRRRRRTVGSVLLTSAVAAVTVAVVTAPAPAPAPSAGAGATTVSTTTTENAPPMAAVALVSYRGTQPAGFTVDAVPDGWFLQGVSPFALTIAPTGTTDPDPASYLDKLVVMLQSADGDQTVPTGPGAVVVAGNPGYVSPSSGGYQILTFDDGAGHVVEVQAAPNLHWGSTVLVRFAAGVHVTAAAAQTHG